MGKGWSPLIQKVFNARESLNAPVGIIQVKEKLGGLRIYTEYYDAELEKTIAEVGRESFHICEICGMAGGLRKLEGRYFTACDQHSNGVNMIPEPWY